jgi:hypothetical protein
MTWRFSDGTVVELGGNVAGSSLFAQTLRDDIASGRAVVQIWPPPGGDVSLDVNDLGHLHQWLTEQIAYWNRVRNVVIRMRSKPDNIPALPAPPWGDAPAEPGVVY